MRRSGVLPYLPLVLSLPLVTCAPTELLDPATLDRDGDGYAAKDDCDDGNFSRNPGLDEVCDGLDNDCDGQVDEGVKTKYYEDADGDAFGNPDADPVRDCSLPPGYALNDLDCDDSDRSVKPGTPEQCNGRDDDCDGEVDEGFDGDGDGYSFCLDDCDDEDPAVNPAAEEQCNGRDDNCDGLLGSATVDEADDDGDGAPNCNDCDPNDATVRPGTYELCDGKDNDCDGVIDETAAGSWCPDADGDGTGDASQVLFVCEGDGPEGWIQICNDCDDNDPDVHPGALEACNGMDDNCDGTIPEAETLDEDGDGFVRCRDCDDQDETVHPGTADTCEDNVDNDCDGQQGEDAVAQVDDEPNDNLGDAVPLGTLDESGGTDPCTTVNGQIVGISDEDYYAFQSVDQLTDNWRISAALQVPLTTRYCVALIDDDPEEPLASECAYGPSEASVEVDMVPYSATRTFYVHVWADDTVALSNTCEPYTLTVCGY